MDAPPHSDSRFRSTPAIDETPAERGLAALPISAGGSFIAILLLVGVLLLAILIGKASFRIGRQYEQRLHHAERIPGAAPIPER